MSLLRAILLAGSESVWLRQRLVRLPFFRRSVSRFMPGETLDDALGAAARLQASGVGTLLTHLGENVAALGEAEAVTTHYLRVIERIARDGHQTQLSVKLTQLGLDVDAEACLRQVVRLATAARPLGQTVWIDMEASRYVDATLDIYRRARATTPNVGLCLQAYLRRTAGDLESLVAVGPSIRLVKGAYREPPSIAFPRKADVDEQFVQLATRLLASDARQAGAFVGLATHDPRLVERLIQLTADAPAGAFEFEMLYGIQTALQRRLVRDGHPLRVLISYGESWFPWYMRRLAERPANVWFVLKNLRS